MSSSPSCLALAVVLQLLRIGPSNASNSLWAEDGPVFLEKAMTHDFLGVLTTAWSERGLGGMAWATGVYGSIGARYTVVPTLLLIGAALVLFDARRRSSSGRPVAELAIIAVLLVPLVTSFDVGAGEARGGRHGTTA